MDLRKFFGRQSAKTEPPPSPPTTVPFWDLGGNRGIVRARNGNLICIDTRDDSVSGQIRRSGEWEGHIEAFYRRLLTNDSVVIDVGSNVGYHVAAFAGIAHSVVAIEANPWAASLLRCTIALNDFRNVSVIEKAVMDHPQSIEIFASPANLGGGAVARASWYEDPNLAAHERHRVEAVTLDTLAADMPSVDLIHMDIEGCELAALRGAQSLLSRSLKVTLIMEWGAYWAPAYGDLTEGLDYLIGLGFHFSKLEPDATLTRQSKEQMLERAFCDVVASRSQITGATA
jgi:FkbM family methyltransferase